MGMVPVPAPSACCQNLRPKKKKIASYEAVLQLLVVLVVLVDVLAVQVQEGQLGLGASIGSAFSS